MTDLQNSCPRLEASQLLRMLQSEDAHQQHEALLVACPCRSRYYDKEIWRAICQIRATTSDPKARDRANHVMGTLAERSRIDLRSVHLLHWLAGQGYAVFIPPWLQKEARLRGASPKGLRLPKAILSDVPALIEALASEDAEDQAQALQVLCPGRTRQYHKKVWLAFFHACHGAFGVPPDQALTATRRLLKRARNDPYAHDVLLWLYHELCDPAETCPPANPTDALQETLERPLHTPIPVRKPRREDPALRGAALMDVDPLIQMVRSSRNPRELRKAALCPEKSGRSLCAFRPSRIQGAPGSDHSGPGDISPDAACEACRESAAQGFSSAQIGRI